MQAGNDAGYVERIVLAEIARTLARTDAVPPDAVTLTIHLAFNPNATPGWFTSFTGIINNVTMLAILLCGSAVIREREHGTMDHLLTLPLSPVEIASAKVLANGFILFVAAGLSLYVIVRALLAVPVAGSIPLFLAGVALYLFFAPAVGLFLATLVRSMPQFGLLFLLVFMPMIMLSGGYTPLESEPRLLQIIMQGIASTHFVSFAKAILFRGTGLRLVYRDYLAIAGLGSVFFALAVLHFRGSTAASGG
jgi:ABC-2 type transport system permease protein